MLTGAEAATVARALENSLPAYLADTERRRACAVSLKAALRPSEPSSVPGSPTRALAGEAVSGDVVLTRRLSDDRALVVLADGLGHGDPAAEAASLCVATLAMHAEANLAGAFAATHDRLRGIGIRSRRTRSAPPRVTLCPASA